MLQYLKWFRTMLSNVCEVQNKENLKKKLDMADKEVLELQIAEREVRNFDRKS